MRAKSELEIMTEEGVEMNSCKLIVFWKINAVGWHARSLVRHMSRGLFVARNEVLH
jgi:hypothetical protein